MITNFVKKAPVTMLLFAIMSIVFGAAQILGHESVRPLALMSSDFPEAWHTIITYGFVHVQWFHILVNMAILVYVGSWVERLIGKPRYLILIILGVLAGGISIVVRDTGGIGFSAAAAGILFYYHLAFPWKRELPLDLPNIVLPTVLLIASILAIIFGWLPGVGHYPHLAGAATGVILLLLFRSAHREI